MSKIVLSGYYGFANAGDEAMLTAILGSLRQARPGVEITVISGNPAYTESKHQVQAVHRFAPLAIWRELASADLLLSGGGSLLQDVTSKSSLIYYLTILALGKLLSKKVMLFSQGIGPINSGWGRFVTKLVCNQADLITVREDGSYEELKSMGVASKKIVVTADAVFSLPLPEQEKGKATLRRYGWQEGKPLVGLALRKWSGYATTKQELAKLATGLQQELGAQILFLPLQYPADAVAAQEVIDLMPNKQDVVLVNTGLTTAEYIDVISNCKLLIGIRLHALIFAALAQVPFLAISYDPKIDRFVASMGGKAACKINELEAATVLRAAVAKWQETDVQQQENINALRMEAQENIRRALAFLPAE